jgi:hypothetical protein
MKHIVNVFEYRFAIVVQLVAAISLSCSLNAAGKPLSNREIAEVKKISASFVGASLLEANIDQRLESYALNKNAPKDGLNAQSLRGSVLCEGGECNVLLSLRGEIELQYTYSKPRRGLDYSRVLGVVLLNGTRPLLVLGRNSGLWDKYRSRPD